MELHGKHCTVRPFRATDAVSVAAVANDRRIWEQLRDLFPHPYALADAQRYIDRVETLDPPRSLAIVVDGQAVGAVGIEIQNDVNRRSAEIGYWLGVDFWGRGVASEALHLVSPWAFTTHDLLRLYALPFADNLASIRVLEKAGFELEGLLRQSAVKDGRIRDQKLYARLRAVAV